MSRVLLGLHNGELRGEYTKHFQRKGYAVDAAVNLDEMLAQAQRENMLSIAWNLNN